MLLWPYVVMAQVCHAVNDIGLAGLGVFLVVNKTIMNVITVSILAVYIAMIAFFRPYIIVMALYSYGLDPRRMHGNDRIFRPYIVVMALYSYGLDPRRIHGNDCIFRTYIIVMALYIYGLDPRRIHGNDRILPTVRRHYSYGLRSYGPT